MKHAFALIEAMIFIVIVLIVAALGATVFSRRVTPTRSACQVRLEQVGLGMMQYAQDAGNIFPPVRLTDTTGWADAILPYIKSPLYFQCPAVPRGKPHTTDYFYNRRLAHLAMSVCKSPEQTISLGEGNDNAPTWNSVSQMPSSWLSNENSPARRHRDGANYVFADGHVKWLAPMGIRSTFRERDSTPTFAFR
ncbi:hypothetical protein EON83_17015 [bacterium]|nr:MAG: hypothetical protein EON83_17015 [bacterium]